MGKECAICLNDINRHDEKHSEIIAISECSHVFHYSCLNMWSTFCTSTEKSCPLCRTVIREDVLVINYDDIEDLENDDDIIIIADIPAKEWDQDKNGTIYIELPVPRELKE